MKRFFTLAFLAIALPAVFAQTSFQDGQLTYTVTSGTNVEVSSVNDKDASGNVISTITVPATVSYQNTEYAVTRIGERAFQYRKMAKVILPNSIVSIGTQAFSSTDNMTGIELPSSLKTIDNFGFSYTNLTEIDIPASVESIGNSAFASCRKLAKVTMHDGLKTIGSSVFYHNALSEVTVPSTVSELGDKAFLECDQLVKATISEGVTRFGDGVFALCKNLRTVNFPSTLTEIGLECFMGCKTLTAVTIGPSLETIGQSAFGNSGIVTFNIDPANKNFVLEAGILYAADKHMLYAVPMKGVTAVDVNSKCIGISGGAFWGSEVTKVKLPDGMLAIDDYAFCQSPLAEINFPNSITYMGEQAFAATMLTSVVLPANMPYVFDGVFAGCTKLTDVTIPSGCKMIYNHAFHNDAAIKSFTCLGSVPPVIDDFYETYDNPFYGIPEKTPLYVPKGCVAAYTQAGWGSDFKVMEGDFSVFTYTSATPANGATLGKYAEMKADIVFPSDITIVQSQPEVFLRKGSELSGRVIAPDDCWKATTGDNKRTLRVWGSDYDGYTQTFTAENDAQYYLVIPAGVVKNAAGDLNEKIVLEWNGPETPKALAVTSTDPANGTTLPAKYVDMAFTVTFDEDVTVTQNSPAAKLTIGAAEGEEIPAESAWNVTKESSKSIKVWASDYDGYTQAFRPKKATKYFMTIPAGIVKNASGISNEQIVIELNGPAAAELNVVSTTPASKTTVEGVTNMSFDITFDAEVSVANASPAARLCQGSESGTPIEPDDRWVASLQGDKKTVRVWASDYDGYTQTFKPEEGFTYYMVIPAGIAKNADGSENKEITIILYGPEKAQPLTVVSTTPADGTELENKYVGMSFTVEFSDDVTVAVASPDARLHEGSLTGSTIDPDDCWKATAEGKNAVRVWAADYDGFLQSFKPVEGAKYYMVIPAGIVKTADGRVNEEVVIMLNGPAPAPAELEVVSTNPANGSEYQSDWADMKFEVTFSAPVTVVKANPDCKLYVGEAGGSSVDPDDKWVATLQGDNKTVNFWASDYDGFLQVFKVDQDKYVMAIPAGVVKDASGAINGEITITVYRKGMSGIGAITADGNEVEGYYDLNGRRVNGLLQGKVTIVRFTNGHSIKMHAR